MRTAVVLSAGKKERSIEKVYSGLCEERDAIHIDDFIPSAFKIFK